jgi:hypothetical protein
MTKKAQNSMAEKPDPMLGSSGRKPRGTGVGASSVTTKEGTDCLERERLMEVVVERGNMTAAYKRVVRNKGIAGIDGMTVDELKPYLASEWGRIKSELLEGQIFTAHGIIQSMSSTGNCYDNAMAESFFATFKKGHVFWERFRTKEEAWRRIFEYLEVFYNWVRRHSSLGYKSPVAFEQQHMVLA